MGKNKGKGQRTIPLGLCLSQDQRRLLLSIIPNETSLSSRSIDDEAGHPDPPGLAHYIKPSLIDALDLELPATLEGAITIYGHGSVVAASASADCMFLGACHELEENITDITIIHANQPLTDLFEEVSEAPSSATGSGAHIDQLSVTPV